MVKLSTRSIAMLLSSCWITTLVINVLHASKAFDHAMLRRVSPDDSSASIHKRVLPGNVIQLKDGPAQHFGALEKSGEDRVVDMYDRNTKSSERLQFPKTLLPDEKRDRASSIMLEEIDDSSARRPISGMTKETKLRSPKKPFIDADLVRAEEKRPNNSFVKESTSTTTSQRGDRDQHRPHPFAGARDERGRYGYVADVSSIKRKIDRVKEEKMASNKSKLKWLDDRNGVVGKTLHSAVDRFEPFLLDEKTTDAVCNNWGSVGKADKSNLGYQLFSKKIVVGGAAPSLQKEGGSHTSDMDPDVANSARNGDGGTTFEGEPPRILCVVMTISNRSDNVRAIGETWGHRCDGFFAASNHTDPDISAVDIPHLGLESWWNLWHKVRSIFSYVHDNHLNDFDFFHISGDDTLLIVENLRNFAWSKGGGRGSGGGEYPLYLGHEIQWKKPNDIVVFAGGGAGYTFNRATLRRLVEVMPTCVDDSHFLEDVTVARCLRTINITVNDTRDALGEQRYHGNDPIWVTNWQNYSTAFTEWFQEHVFAFWQMRGWNPQKGLGAASSQSISFHHMATPNILRRWHSILYKSCPPGTRIGDALM